MGEFDLSLIQEFRSRPAFYDRNSPRFKDKLFTAREWQGISNKLGYDVSILKDRMLQLRNRYNLEKRRLEQLCDEHPGKVIESPWPLYPHLHFLSKHIRARRSFKRLIPHQNSTEQLTNSNSGSYMSPSIITPQMCHPSVPFPNGMVAVKMEPHDSDGGESDSPSSGDIENFIPPNNPTMMVETNLMEHSTSVDPKEENSLAPSPPTPISIRRLDTMQQKLKKNAQHAARDANSSYERKPVVGAPGTTIPNNADACHFINQPPELLVREQKYAAFGNFISSSLLELPPNKALTLVEKFTSDLVKVLIQKHEPKEEPPAAIPSPPTEMPEPVVCEDVIGA